MSVGKSLIRSKLTFFNALNVQLCVPLKMTSVYNLDIEAPIIAPT